MPLSLNVVFHFSENNTGKIGLPAYPVTVFRLPSSEQPSYPFVPRGSFILAPPIPPGLRLSLIFHFAARYLPLYFDEKVMGERKPSNIGKIVYCLSVNCFIARHEGNPHGMDWVAGRLRGALFVIDHPHRYPNYPIFSYCAACIISPCFCYSRKRSRIEYP